MTVQITLNFEAMLEDFVALVDECDIDELLVELAPADVNIQSPMPAELSVHGASLDDTAGQRLIIVSADRSMNPQGARDFLHPI